MPKLDISNAQIYKSSFREMQQIFWMKIQFTLKEVEWKGFFFYYILNIIQPLKKGSRKKIHF